MKGRTKVKAGVYCHNCKSTIKFQTLINCLACKGTEQVILVDFDTYVTCYGETSAVTALASPNYSRRHQTARFKVTAKSYNVAT
jgi:hypothetical protein